MKKMFFFFILVLCEGVLALVAIKCHNTSSLLITEVCSHNDTVIYDKKGLFSDYVEIYNNSSVPINLADYHLSDKDSIKSYYKLQSEILEPGQYTVVFISKIFSVSDEETIYLFDALGKVVDYVEVGFMESDKVWARDFATMEWKENVPPSPGKKNIFEDAELLKTPEDIFPTFSVEPGFYEEAFYLEMYVEGDYDIYYTLDGTVPDKNSILYTEPVYITDVTSNDNVYASITDITVLEDSVVIPSYPIDKCNVIRAVAIGENGERSRENVGFYFINYNERDGYDDVYVLSMTTDPENLFSKERGIYVTGVVGENCWYSLEEKDNPYVAIVNYTRSGKGWKRPAVVELFDKDRKQLYNQDIQISIHGGYSTAFTQKGFNLIALDTTYEKEYVFPELFEEGQSSNTSLMLRAGGFRDWEVTKFRDVLNHSLIEDRDVTILRSVPCQVFIDGEYWGLYNLQERIDAGLIAKNFGVKEEDVLILKNKNVVGNNDELYSLYSEVERYAVENDLSLEENYEYMKQLIDVQSYIDYYCFQIYVANCDSIANNYSCWRTLTASDEPYYDGRWRWIVYDTDDSIGMVEDLAEPDTDSFREGHWTTAPMDDPFFSSLIKNEEFKQHFVDTFMEMADTNFAYENVEPLINELCEQYMQPMILSCKRFEDRNLSKEGYLQRVEVIKEFFAGRREYIVDYMEAALGLSS